LAHLAQRRLLQGLPATRSTLGQAPTWRLGTAHQHHVDAVFLAPVDYSARRDVAHGPHVRLTVLRQGRLGKEVAPVAPLESRITLRGPVDPYRALYDRALSRLDPELAHRLALAALRRGGGLARLLRPRPDAALGLERWGLRFPNPLGVAAGLDKDAVAVR